MDIDVDHYPTVNGKVLLFTSRDDGAAPAMTIAHETVSELPPVLRKLARRFSPIRSKFILYSRIWTHIKCVVQIQTVAFMSQRTKCGLLGVDSLRLSWMMIQ